MERQVQSQTIFCTWRTRPAVFCMQDYGSVCSCIFTFHYCNCTWPVTCLSSSLQKQLLLNIQNPAPRCTHARLKYRSLFFCYRKTMPLVAACPLHKHHTSIFPCTYICMLIHIFEPCNNLKCIQHFAIRSVPKMKKRPQFLHKKVFSQQATVTTSPARMHCLFKASEKHSANPLRQ